MSASSSCETRFITRHAVRCNLFDKLSAAHVQKLATMSEDFFDEDSVNSKRFDDDIVGTDALKLGKAWKNSAMPLCAVAELVGEIHGVPLAEALQEQCETCTREATVVPTAEATETSTAPAAVDSSKRETLFKFDKHAAQLNLHRKVRGDLLDSVRAHLARTVEGDSFDYDLISTGTELFHACEDMELSVATVASALQVAGNVKLANQLRKLAE